MKTIVCALAILVSAGAIYGQQQPAKDAKAASPGASSKKAYKDLNPEAFDKMRRTGTNVVVLDVRTAEEYQEGHIPGSILIDFNSPDFEKKVAKLDKSKTYLVHCAGGGRSSRACKKMGTLDFPKLYNLEGGMGAWEKAKKPVEK